MTPLDHWSIGVLMIGFAIFSIFTNENTTKKHNLKYMRREENDTSDNECTRTDNQVDDDCRSAYTQNRRFENHHKGAGCGTKIGW